MIINLRELATKEAPADFQASLDLSELVSDRSDIRLERPVQAQVTAQADSGLVTVDGRLVADLHFVCSKCLKQYEEQVTYPVHELFTQQAEVAERDEEIHLNYEERVDLTPYLSDTFVVHLPYAPACDAACKGLCPVCGADRNTSECTCAQEKVDPRLAGLKDFFK